MANYKHLFSIKLFHTYFSDSRCRNITLSLTPSCKKTVENAGLLIREERNGITVFYNEADQEALQLYARDELIFSFNAWSKDPLFFNYTDLPGEVDGTIFYFNNLRVKEALLISRNEFVSGEDRTALDSPLLQERFTKKERVAPPLFIVDIHPSGGGFPVLKNGLPFCPRDYSLKFKARETYWTYFIVGKLKEEAIEIFDLNQEIDFVQLEDRPLPGSRRAAVFRSVSRVPLEERSKQSFQIRQKGKHGKILIKRLPVASPELIHFGENHIPVSEIFINH